MKEFEVRVSKVTRRTAKFRVWAEDKEQARRLFVQGKAQRISNETKEVEKPSMRVRKV